MQSKIVTYTGISIKRYGLVAGEKYKLVHFNEDKTMAWISNMNMPFSGYFAGWVYSKDLI